MSSTLALIALFLYFRYHLNSLVLFKVFSGQQIVTHKKEVRNGKNVREDDSVIITGRIVFFFRCANPLISVYLYFRFPENPVVSKTLFRQEFLFKIVETILHFLQRGVWFLYSAVFPHCHLSVFSVLLKSLPKFPRY